MSTLRGRTFLGLSLAAIFSCAVLAWTAPAGASAAPQASSAAQEQPEKFRPPQAVSVVNAQYPMQTNTGDIVVLDVSLDSQGAVEAVRPLRGVPPLTSAAASALHGWKFRPALEDGSPTASILTAVFVFRPPVSIWEPAPFRPVLHIAQQAGYVPPGILSAVWAQYPVRSVASGSVVVEVAVDAAGKVAGVQVLRPIEGFTPLAVKAARQWRFRPATLDGNPVPSKVAIAFVFANPVLNPFPSFGR
jgi:TonB family protein